MPQNRETDSYIAIGYWPKWKIHNSQNKSTNLDESHESNL